MTCTCRVCGSTRTELALDLGEQPWCNDFLTSERVGTEPFYPLRVCFCTDCRTAQLDTTIPKEVMFGDHTYLSGITSSLSDHFRQTALAVRNTFFPGEEPRAVLDIGSNDGTQLRHYQDLGWEVLGVESSRRTAEIANAQGIPTVNAFFNLDTLRSLGRQFDVINAAGVFFHLEELHSVTEAIREGLKDDGVMVVQFLYMKSIVENLAFDQIYHEHLLYYTLRSIETLLNRHGLRMFDAHLAPIHGGSIIGFIGHRGKRHTSDRLQAMRRAEDVSGINELDTYRRFAQHIETMRERDIAFLQTHRRAGRRVYGLGAPAKGNTLLNSFRIGPDLIQFLVEKNPLRKGLFSPGMHIPIILEKDVHDPPDVYYVLAWNFRREILRNNRALIEKGVQFYFPVTPKER